MKPILMISELKIHAPFTAFGTVTGTIIMAAFLFLAIRISCCAENMVFPLLWIKKEEPA